MTDAIDMDAPRVALVTGANKGLGFAIAQQLAELGLIVLAGARDERRGREAVELLRESGDVRFLAIDVTDGASISAAAQEIERDFAALDVLVNNAGVNLERGRPPSEVGPDTVRAVYETNVFGVVAVTQALLPLLRRSRAGRIVNVSSALGSVARAAAPGRGPNLLAYNSSKSALNAITLAYANELRETSIKVNSVSPGYMATDLNQHRGNLSTEQGAIVPVHLATLADDGPTGTFLGENGTPRGEPLPW